MAETGSSGSGQWWMCSSSECGKELPSSLPGMRFCPFCKAELSLKVHSGVQLREGVPNPKDEQETGAKIADCKPKLSEKEALTTSLTGTRSSASNNTPSKDKQTSAIDIKRNLSTDTTLESHRSKDDGNRSTTKDTESDLLVDAKDQTVGGTAGSGGNHGHHSNNVEVDSQGNAGQSIDSAPQQNLKQVFGNPEEKPGASASETEKTPRNPKNGQKKDPEKKQEEEEKRKKLKQQDLRKKREEERKVEVKKRDEEKAKKQKEKEKDRKKELKERDQMSKQQRKDNKNVPTNIAKHDPLHTTEDGQNDHEGGEGSKRDTGKEVSMHIVLCVDVSRALPVLFVYVQNYVH